jgi:peptidoglycan/LPS O-acetylase OafA/YrhL
MTVLIIFLIGLVWVTVFSLLMGESLYREARWWYFWPFTYWFAWALGAFAAEIYTGAVKPKPIYFSPLLCILLFSIGVITSGPILGLFIRTNFFASHFHSGALIAICRLLTNTANFFFAGSFFILLNFLASAERRGKLFRIPRFLPWLGLMSYSFYLTHEPIVTLLQSRLGTDTSVSAVVMRYLLIVPICIGFSWLYYQLVEKRFLNRRSSEIIKENIAVGAGSGKG